MFLIILECEALMTFYKKAYEKLSIPDRHEAMRALERHMDIQSAEKLWIQICDTNDFKPYTEDLDELEIIYRAMSKKGGKTGITGSSMVVKILSYQLLKGQSNGTR